MAKPDMSRNKDLAGKTVSKGGYNISYNENGYATSAIKTGSKTGKAAAPSADTVSGGGSDRGSYGGSVYHLHQPLPEPDRRPNPPNP